MPVEIREIVIKTEIESLEQIISTKVNSDAFEELRSQIMEDCKRMIKKELRNKNSR